jgi:hypothetical protein
VVLRHIVWVVPVNAVCGSTAVGAEIVVGIRAY